MKKTINTLLVISIVAIGMVSCGKKAKDMIAKKWQWSEMKSDDFDKQMADMKAMADTTKDSTMKAMYVQNYVSAQGMIESMKSSTVEYKTDGTFEASMKFGEQAMTTKGTWKVSDDGKKLISTDDKQKTDSLNIESLTDDKLVASSTMNGSTATITFVAIK